MDVPSLFRFRPSQPCDDAGTARFWHPLLIACAIFLAYFGSISGQFLNWDDDYYLHRNPRIRDFSVAGILRLFDPSFLDRHTFIEFLPLRDASYALDYWLFQYLPGGYHLGNLVFHTVASLLVYLLVIAVFKNAKAALCAGLLFAIHPCHTESVAWVACRKDAIFMSLMLGAMILYYRHLLGELGRSAYFGAILLYCLSLLSKSFPLTLPFLLLASGYLGWPRSSLKRLLPFFVLSLLFAFNFIAVGVEKDLVQADYGAWKAIPKVVSYYFLGEMLPFPLCQRYDVAVPASLLSLEVVLPMAGLAILGFILSKVRLGPFALAWLVIALLPVLNIVPFPILIADRYQYMPSLGFALAGGFWLAKSPKVAAVILLCFGLLTSAQTRVFADSRALWTDVLENYPQLQMAALNLADAHRQQGAEDRAEIIYRQILHSDPNSDLANLNLGNLLRRRGAAGEALLHYGAVNQDGQFAALALMNQGTALLQLRRFSEAEAAYRRSLKVSVHDHYRDNAVTYYNLAFLASARGNHAEAKHWLETLLEVVDYCTTQQVIETANLLAVVGELAKGAQVLQKGLDLCPSSAYEQALTVYRKKAGLK